MKRIALTLITSIFLGISAACSPLYNPGNFLQSGYMNAQDAYVKVLAAILLKSSTCDNTETVVAMTTLLQPFQNDCGPGAVCVSAYYDTEEINLYTEQIMLTDCPQLASIPFFNPLHIFYVNDSRLDRLSL